MESRKLSDYPNLNELLNKALWYFFDLQGIYPIVEGITIVSLQKYERNLAQKKQMLKKRTFCRKKFVFVKLSPLL